LTITIDSVTIRKDYSAQTPFDAGEPHGNREWKPDRPVRLGSYTFRLDAITFIGDGYKLDLSYKSLPENVSFFINIIDASSEPFQFDHIDGTHIDDGNTAQDTITLTTQNPPPTGNMIIQWQLSETIPEPGPWTLIWTPPANKP